MLHEYWTGRKQVPQAIHIKIEIIVDSEFRCEHTTEDSNSERI